MPTTTDEKQFVDSGERIRVSYPPDWEVESHSDDVSEYFRFHPLGARGISLLVTVSPAPPGVTLTQIHGERRRQYEQAKAPALVNATAFQWTDSLGATVDGVRYCFDTDADQVVVEESLLASGGEIMLVQARWIAGSSSRYQRSRLLRTRESLELLPVAARPRLTPTADATEITTPARWHLRKRDVSVNCDAETFTLDVDYRVQVENNSGSVSQRLHFRLLAPPLLQTVSAAVNGIATEPDVSDESTLVIDLAEGVAPAGAVNIEVRYRLHFAEINPVMHARRRLFFDAGSLVCATANWVPQLVVAEGRAIAHADEKCPFRLTVEVPDSWAVYASGARGEQGAASGRATNAFGGAVPYVCFLARRKKDQREVRYSGANVNVVVSAPDNVRLDEAFVLEMARVVDAGFGRLSAWYAKPSTGDQVSLVLYDGDVCLGYGPLLLIGRGFETVLGRLDEEVFGQTTLRETILHELAHLWFGGLLTAAGAHWSRLHEMLAGYLSLRLLEEIGGHDAFEQARRRALDVYERMYSLPSVDNAGYQGNWHAKWGMVAFEGLQAQLGKAVVDSALRRLFECSDDGRFTEADLRRALDDVTAGKGTGAIARWLPSGAVPPAPPAGLESTGNAQI